ncbi:glycoside hydrolase family 12 protein [Stemphylium lycopersici]|uniref:Glycoside hydrolase family 12 protein n=1 Tax=Stemphylium lycopersici TaxID=183478 RepID=A0A364MXB7_STELY|nr:glycoside hydrolase family 12 protein [Stemphylium lycopersici]RAR11925.1 glycoside hydrolase family 12 protein [Stemphylium lycopersici]
MKLSTFIAVSSASLALAVPTATIQKRADFCGQWDSQVTGDYTIYNNLWGRADATSGSQCTGVDGLSGRSLKWHTSWSWSGGAGHVKSYANVVTDIGKKALSSIKSLPSVWKWTYTGDDLIANVSYDLFTSSTADGDEEYEIMIWLAGLGGAGPISATGSPIATVNLAGSSWKLYNGQNGQMNVFSFVAENQVQNFDGDLMDFVNYLSSEQSLPSSQILISAGAGTEPFSGSNAKLSVSEYSLAEN